MGVREKLLDFKRRLQDRKMYSIVLVVIAVTASWGIFQYKRAAELRQELDNQYSRSLYDLVGYVQNVEVLLSKAMLTTAPSYTALMMQEAWRQSNLAQTNLGQLPVSQAALEDTSKFLTQVGDFSYSLDNQNLNGKPLTDEQYSMLQELHGFALNLENSLNEFVFDLNQGRIRWGDISRKGTPLFQKASKNIMQKEIEDIEKQFQEYPTLIYDGPFSDHLDDIKPRGLDGGQEISEDEARQRAMDFMGSDKIKGLNSKGLIDYGNFKAYDFEIVFDGSEEGQSGNISIAQLGGKPVWMLNNRTVPASDIEVDQAKQMGREYLLSKGFEGMVDTYYLKEDNTATINYAYKQDGVTVYPDLIKLKIALDTGEVVGFESKGYLASHTIRDIEKPRLSLEQAMAKINPKLDVKSSGMAIIPTNFKTEILTYEFKGRLNERDFIIYINANTGKEENILLIIDTPNGILTM